MFLFLGGRRKVDRESTFDDQSVSNWGGVEKSNSAPWAQTFSADTTRFGHGYSLRIEVHKTDVVGSKYVRSEIRDTPYLAKDKWFGYSMYVPNSMVPDSIEDIISQWHDVPDPGEYFRDAPISFRMLNGKYYINLYWSSLPNNYDTTIKPLKRLYDGTKVYQVDTVVTGWQDFVWHIRFSYSDDGLIEVWHNGKPWFKREGPNCFNDRVYPFFKFGIYKGGWYYMKHFSNTESRLLFFDNMRTATNASYSDVDPSVDR